MVLLTVNALGPDYMRTSDRDELAGSLVAIVCVLTVCVAAYRLMIYIIGTGVSVPPISILGRIFTLRFIVPGYDKIFVAPIIAVAVILLGPFVSFCFGVPTRYSLPCCLAVALLVLLRMPPSLRSWELTGTFRSLRPGRKDKRFISPSST